MLKRIMGLCRGRHELPEVEGYIYDKELTLDFNSLEDTCHEVLKDCCELTLYVTGFTPALTTVISYCVFNSVKLTLMHYDRDSNDYIPQEMHIKGFLCNSDNCLLISS